MDALTLPQYSYEMQSYKEKVALESDFERTELNLEKTGVFTGSFAKNPISEELVPIWVADYVLATYGTGAVMGVPGSCERDFDFAQKHNVPIFPVVEPTPSAYEESKRREPFEQFKERVRTGQAPWEGDGIICRSENGKLSLNGLSCKDAREKVAEWLETNSVGKRSVHYKLRDWLFSRQRYWAEPIPVLHFQDGTFRTLGIDELPLLPPEIEDYKPAGDGQSPLSKVRSWVEITDTKTGKQARRETNTMPQWAGSCWYYIRFCDPHNPHAAWSKEAEKYWLPVDLYVVGVEHAVLHLLYSRFWHKVL